MLVDPSGVHQQKLSALAFYSTNLHVNSSAKGGWDPFGPERIITRSKDNILYEMDHQPALDLYRRYLGEQALNLPLSRFHFPLELETAPKESVVRAVLGVSESDGSLQFAGDMPEGAKVRLMKFNANRLLDGAVQATQSSLSVFPGTPQLAILVSCLGRKWVLGERTEEELEEVQEVLSPQVPMIGFYSAGEIAPSTPGTPSQLHNETMSITLLSED